MDTVRVQQIESAAVALAVFVAFIAFGYSWWWLPALFLAFDISAIGYLRGPWLGSITYNLGHSYAVPAVISVIWAVLAMAGHSSYVLGVITGAWFFHIAVDRALGFGLKFPDSFTSTHLGGVGGRDHHP